MTELQQVERDIAAYKNQVALGELLERLSSNKDFKSLILDGFLRENAIRLVELKAHPAQQEPHKQAAIMRQMDGVGVLGDFFRSIRQQSELGKESLVNSEDMRAALLREAQGMK